MLTNSLHLLRFLSRPSHKEKKEKIQLFQGMCQMILQSFLSSADFVCDKSSSDDHNRRERRLLVHGSFECLE